MKTCQTCNCDVPRGAHRCPNCGGYSIKERNPFIQDWAEPEFVSPPYPEALQAKARAYCLSLGLDTPEKVRAHAEKLAKTAFNKSPNKDWAGNILRRVEDGEKMPHWVVHCSTEVASKP